MTQIQKNEAKKLSFLSRINTSSEDKDYFIENLAMLLSSGMDILAALESVKHDLKSKGMKDITDIIKDDIDAGLPIWEALDNVKIFPPHVISLMKIGEATGQLSKNLVVIVEERRKSRTFRSKIRSAMMYPLLIMSLTVVIGVGIAWFILPRLADVFSSLKLELPLVTKVLITVGIFLGEYGQFAIPAFLIVVALIFYYIFIFKKTNYMGQWILLHFPAVKVLIKQVELARFGYILGSMLKSGLPVIEALNSLSQATTIRAYQKFYIYLYNQIEQGQTFQQSFATYEGIDRLIPHPIQQMVVASEKSGQLPETLLKAGEIFEAKTDVTTKNLSVVLEPILLVIVWAGVVAVALAVILPIYSLIGGLNSNESTNSSPPPTPAVEGVSYSVNQQLEITETGFGPLTVLGEPEFITMVVGQVPVGNIYDYTAEQNGWYQIIFEENKTGWVFGKFVRLID
jgi:type IV pilus assembly protein PilC